MGRKDPFADSCINIARDRSLVPISKKRLEVSLTTRWWGACRSMIRLSELEGFG